MNKADSQTVSAERGLRLNRDQLQIYFTPYERGLKMTDLD